MQHKKLLFSSAVLFGILLSTGTAFGQNTGNVVSGPPAPTAVIMSSEGIIGKPVHDAQGQQLGRIESLIMNIDTNQVGYAVLSPTGVPDLGPENILVPWAALKINPATDDIALDLTPDQLRNAPKGRSIASREQEVAIHRFYGVSPYWGGPLRQTQPVPAPEEPGYLEQPEPSLREPNVEGGVPGGGYGELGTETAPE